MAFPLFTSDAAIPAPHSDHATERAARLHDLALGYRLFGALNWGSTGDGHITARDPELTDHLWLARYGVAFNRVRVADLVLVGPNGTVVEAPGGVDSGINSAAFLIHWPIHEARPDIVAAAHTHTPYGTPFAATGEMLRALSQESCAFAGLHAMFDDDELDIVTLDGGKRIAAALGEHRSIILRNHGTLTAGATVGEAVGLYVTMERVCEVNLKAGDRGIPISDEAARLVAQSVGTPEQAWHQFQWLIRHHLPDPTVVL